MDKRERIYICHTLHHVVVSMIKALHDNDNNSIVITEHIPEYNVFIERLKKVGVFKNVFFVESSKLNYSYKPCKVFYYVNAHRHNYRLNKKYIDINFGLYSDVYIFVDWAYEGFFLQDARVKYHLIEDGVDHFVHILDYSPDYAKEIDRNVKNYLRQKLNIGYCVYGTSKYCLDVEVNNAENVIVPKRKKIIEFPKEKLFDLITDEDLAKLNSVFLDDSCNHFSKKEKILILTQPLFLDKYVASEKEQIDVYKRIIDEFGNSFSVFIKPHPRDTIDYSIFSNCFLINKTVPTEIININKSIFFEKAVTISSSSIFVFDNIGEKITLGRDYLSKKDVSYD